MALCSFNNSNRSFSFDISHSSQKTLLRVKLQEDIWVLMGNENAMKFTFHFPLLSLSSYFYFFLYLILCLSYLLSYFICNTCIALYYFPTLIHCQIALRYHVLQPLFCVWIHFGSHLPIDKFLVSKNLEETNLDKCSSFILLENMVVTPTHSYNSSSWYMHWLWLWLELWFLACFFS